MPGTTFSSSNWTAYDSHATNLAPSAALTDFTLIIDVSTLSATFKSTVQSDGADIRITKNDGTTELAYDLIDWAYNAGAPTGQIRVKWSSTLATSGTQKTHIYYGYTLGTAVAYDASETYGSDNAYDSGWWAYWPLHDLNDRTANGRTLIKTAALTMGGVSGQVTPATDFDGTNDWCRYVTTWGADTTDVTIMYWQNLATADVGSDGVFGSEGTSSSTDNIRGLAWSDTNLYFDYGNTTTGRENADYTSYLDKWSHVACVSEGAGGSFKGIYFDGTVAASDTGSSDGPAGITSKDFFVGRAFNSLYKFNGSLNDFQVHQVRRTADWIAEEHSQTSNNASHFGTWTSTAVGGGGTTVTPTAASVTMTAVAPTLNFAATVTPTPASSTFAVSAPTVSQGGVLTPTPATTSAQAVAPSLDFNTVMTPNPAAMTATAQEPTISAPSATQDITPTPAAMTTQAASPTLSFDTVLTPDPAVVSFDIASPVLSVPGGSATITPTPATVLFTVGDVFMVPTVASAFTKPLRRRVFRPARLRDAPEIDL